MIAQFQLIHETTIFRHIADYFGDGKLISKNGGHRSIAVPRRTQSPSYRQYPHHHSQYRCPFQERFDVCYSIPGMNKWLHRNGFTYKKPSGIPHKFCAKKQQQFIDRYTD